MRRYEQNKSNRNNSIKKVKSISAFAAILPLAACGGGSVAPTSSIPTPAPAPDPDFIENPTNVFIARDDSGGTLSEGANNANLTVTGGAGSDSITTGAGADNISAGAGNDTIISNNGNDTIHGGAGNDTITSGNGDDLIRGGEGRDGIDGGAGNDAIIVVGTTSADQYNNTDITNPAGSGQDLSDLITLADLNDRTVSEVVSGEIINGGSGTNTLYIYGTVDLTGVTLSNITTLIVNSDVTLTPEQIAQFATIDGDGSSVINIEIPSGSSDTYILDLSAVDLSDVANINIDGDITVKIDDASALNGVGAISSGLGDKITVEVIGNGSDTTINLGDIADTFEKVDIIEIEPNVTLEIDNASDVTSLGLEGIAGDGEIDTNGDPDVQDALNDNVEVSKPKITINDVDVDEVNESAIFTVTLSKTYFEQITVDYTAPDGTSGTLTFNPGEISKTFDSDWSDDDVFEPDAEIVASLSNPTNATILDGTGYLTIIDDDSPDPVLELTDLDGENGFQLNGIDFNGAAGFSVSDAGDFNNDGYDDFLIGAIGGVDEPSDVGKTFLIFGGANVDGGDGAFELASLQAADGSTGFQINGINRGDESGRSVSNAGDINNDGFDDLIIGASYADTNGDRSGESYVIYGGVGVDGGDGSFELSSLASGDGSAGFQINGVDETDFSGGSVSNVGDVNSDGFDDFIIGARFADSNGVASGESYLIYGGVGIDGGDGSFELSSLASGDGSTGFRINGVDDNDRSGVSVSGAGDVNGDGYDDFIIGARLGDSNAGDSGESYIVYGGSDIDGGDGTFELSSLASGDGSAGFQLDGIDLNDYSGFSVSSAGDINRDGYSDIIIAASYADANGDSSGEVYVVYGGQNVDGGDGVFELSSLASGGGTGFQLNGINAGDGSGRSVSGAGDVNGDGYDDLLIGASTAESSTLGSGEVYVVYGGVNIDGGDGIFELSSLASGDGSTGFHINGKNIYDEVGNSVSLAGDVNGDGYDDLIIGARAAGDAGESYIIYGASSSYNTYMGSLNDDVFTSTSSVESFIGRGGNDTLIIEGASSEDIFDGGDDIDRTIYRIQGPDAIDLSEQSLANMEQVELDGDWELILTVQDLLDVTDIDNELLVLGDETDTITSLGQGWVQGVDQVIDTDTYNSYSVGGATLLVDADIIQDIS